jgi:chromosome segregation ATPase
LLWRSDLTKTSESQSVQISELAASLKGLQQSLESRQADLKAAYERSDADRAAHTEAAQGLAAKIKELERAKGALEAAVESRAAELSRAQEAQAESAREHERAAAQLQREMAELKAASEQRLAQEQRSGAEAVARKQGEADSSKATLTAQMEQLRALNSKLATAHKGTSAEFAQLKVDCEEAAMKLQTAQAEIKTLDQQLNEEKVRFQPVSRLRAHL